MRSLIVVAAEAVRQEQLHCAMRNFSDRQQITRPEPYKEVSVAMGVLRKGNVAREECFVYSSVRSPFAQDFSQLAQTWSWHLRLDTNLLSEGRKR